MLQKMEQKLIHSPEALHQLLVGRSLTSGEVYASKEETWTLLKLLVLLDLSNIKCLEENPGELLSKEEEVN